jgi:hypothetical protein
VWRVDNDPFSGVDQIGGTFSAQFSGQSTMNISDRLLRPWALLLSDLAKDREEGDLGRVPFVAEGRRVAL